MLKIEVYSKPVPDKPEQTSRDVTLEVSGSLKEVISETCTAINSIYISLVKKDPRAGRGFRELLSLEVLLPDSELWNPDQGKMKGYIATMKIPKGGKTDD